MESIYRMGEGDYSRISVEWYWNGGTGMEELGWRVVALGALT